MSDSGHTLEATAQNKDGDRLGAKYSGPLPHPAVLKQFDDVLPGSAKQIFDMALAEQQNRFKNDETDRSVSRANATRQLISTLLGQATSFIIAVSGIGGAIYLISTGKGAEGLAIVLTPLAGLGLIVWGFKDEIRESMKKSNKK